MPPDVANIPELGQVESFPESHWPDWKGAAGFWHYFWLVVLNPFLLLWNPHLIETFLVVTLGAGGATTIQLVEAGGAAAHTTICRTTPP